jgi:hypothetical protein
MPPFIQPTAQNGPASGTTRTIDLSLAEYDLGSRGTMIWRSGVVVSGMVNSGGDGWLFRRGRQALVISSGLGYGWFCSYGLVPLIQRIANRGALAAIAGVTRLLVSMAVDDMSGVTNPNSDIGVDVLIGLPSGISDLRTANNTHLAGSSGWAVLFMPSGMWDFVVKQPDTNSGVFSESTPLPDSVQTALNSGEPSEIEFRVIDATASAEAKMQLWINGVKILTRYWVAGQSADALLPPLGTVAAGVTGTVLILQLRNTSTGPPAMYFYRPQLIQGPNDSGTL